MFLVSTFACVPSQHVINKKLWREHDEKGYQTLARPTLRRLRPPWYQTLRRRPLLVGTIDYTISSFFTALTHLASNVNVVQRMRSPWWSSPINLPCISRPQKIPCLEHLVLSPGPLDAKSLTTTGYAIRWMVCSEGSKISSGTSGSTHPPI
jgi:hypothetical protein